MRIAIVAQPYYPQPGGVSEHVHHTALEFRKLGHEVDIITSRFRKNGKDTEGVLRIGRNALVPHLGAFANVNADPWLHRDVRRILRRNEYDVLHVHEPLTPTLPLLALRRTVLPAWHNQYQYQIHLQPHLDILYGRQLLVVHD